MVQRIEREAMALKPSRLAPSLVPWGNGPSARKLWIPEQLTPLWGTDVYDDLTREQRLRYNQYFALKLSEEFIWLETFALIPPLKKLLKGAVPAPAFRSLLKSFVVDEINHSATVRQLLRKARPDFYSKNDFFFFKPPHSVAWILAMAGRMPRLLSCWALFSGLLEEKTITISRMYQQANEDVDPLFATIFTLHALDEARHCKFDSLIAEWLIGPQRTLPKWFNGTILGLLYKRYIDPSWGSAGPIRQIVVDFPEIRELETRMIKESQRINSIQNDRYATDRSFWME